MHRQYKIGDNMAKSGKEPVNISSLYADLQRFADAQSYDKALKTADTSMYTLPLSTWIHRSFIVLL